MDQQGANIPQPIPSESPVPLRQPLPRPLYPVANIAISSGRSDSFSLEKPLNGSDGQSARDLLLPALGYVSQEHNNEAPQFNSRGNVGSPRPATSRQPTGVDVDHVVPLEESEKSSWAPLPLKKKTVEDRLKDTLAEADKAQKKYASKVRTTGILLNAANGAQIALGALTTALAAATTGRQSSIAISILGGLATIVASYLTRARVSNEPELSIARKTSLEQFLREIRAFILDHGDSLEFESRVQGFRKRFEELLGNKTVEPTLEYKLGPGPAMV